MHQLAPLLLLGGVGERRAKRLPDFGPRDRVAHAFLPRGLGVGSRGANGAPGEVLRHVVDVEDLGLVVRVVETDLGRWP